MQFPYTEEGYSQSCRFLKIIGKYEEITKGGFSTDGWSVISDANSLYEKYSQEREEHLKQVPDKYKGMFYPPQLLFMDSTPSGWDWEKARKDAEWMIMEMNLSFFAAITGKPIEEEPDEHKLLSRLKYALIVENGERYITYVDNETMNAYRLKDNSYYNGLLYPLEEIKDFTFERWARGMDL